MEYQQQEADGPQAGESSPQAGVQDTQLGDVGQQQWLNKAALYEILAMGLRLPTPELATALLSGEFADALVEIGSVNHLDVAAVDAAVTQLGVYSGSAVADDVDVCAAAADGDALADNEDESANDNGDEAADRLFHRLRACYTGLLVGAPEPAVSPYAGVWWARSQGVEPLLFVNRRSMDIERFMRSVGIGQAEGKNEPLDHIATMLEFLQYTAMVLAGVAEQPAAQSAEQPAAAAQLVTAERPAAAAAPPTQLATDTQPAAATPPTSPPALITVETHDRFISDYLADWVPQFSTKISEKTDEPLYLAIALLLIESV